MRELFIGLLSITYILILFFVLTFGAPLLTDNGFNSWGASLIAVGVFLGLLIGPLAIDDAIQKMKHNAWSKGYHLGLALKGSK